MNSTTTSLVVELVSYTWFTWLFGVNTVQAYRYFQTYNDRLVLKLTVIVVVILDLANALFTCWGSYLQVVSYLRKSPVSNLPLTLAMIATVFHTLVIQCFFIHSIYWISGRNKLLTLFIVILVVIAFACALTSVLGLFRENVGLESGNSLVITAIPIGLSTVTDLVVTVSLVMCLFRGKSSIRSTSNLLDKLIGHAVQRGILITAAQVLATIFLFAMRNTPIWITFQPNVTKIYTLTFLANLNRRDSLRQTAAFNVNESSLHIPPPAEDETGDPHGSGDVGSNIGQ